MTEGPIPEADMAAYKAAQKKRNLYIGGGLLIFVILVFVISIARMAEGMKHDRERHAQQLSNVPVASAGASVQ